MRYNGVGEKLDIEEWYKRLELGKWGIYWIKGSLRRVR